MNEWINGIIYFSHDCSDSFCSLAFHVAPVPPTLLSLSLVGCLEGQRTAIIFKVRKEKCWNSSNNVIRVELFLNLLDVKGAELKKEKKKKSYSALSELWRTKLIESSCHWFHSGGSRTVWQWWDWKKEKSDSIKFSRYWCDSNVAFFHFNVMFFFKSVIQCQTVTASYICFFY